MASVNPAVPRPSALSGVAGEMVAEFFGTMVLLLFGDGCVASFLLFSNNVVAKGGASVPGGFVPVTGRSSLSGGVLRLCWASM